MVVQLVKTVLFNSVIPNVVLDIRPLGNYHYIHKLFLKFLSLQEQDDVSRTRITFVPRTSELYVT